jgi:rRNA pseudouridine-1189 N-methylase Emg1 (Nep1/Mra1 family)
MDSKTERIVNKIMEKLTNHDNTELLKCIKKVVTDILEEENQKVSSIYDDDENEEEEEVEDEQVVEWVVEMLNNI